MWWAAAIGAAFSLFGASKEAKAASQAKDLGFANARASEAETMETLRRTKASQKQIQGYTEAAGSASGFMATAGTAQNEYLNEMIAEDQRQNAFTKKAGKREADILRKGGQLAYSQGRAGAVNTLGSGFSSAVALWNA